MSQIALEKDELELFTPKSLENIEPKMIFRFRSPTPRDQQTYNRLLSLEGLRLFSDDDIRTEILRVLKANWDEDTFSRQSTRLESFWAQLDQQIAPSEEETANVAELTTRCMDISPLLRRMDADNKTFHSTAPIIALSLFLAGWKNVNVPFKLEGGFVPYETLMMLSKEIARREKEAEEDKVQDVNPGMGFLQLTLKSFQLLQVDKEEEKNSSAPSPSSETPNGSDTTSKMDGASETTSLAPKKTRRSSSRSGPKS